MTAPGNSAASRDLAYNLHPFTNLKALPEKGPLVIARGEGIRVFDETGRGYLEALGGLWCTALGWGEERLVAAAAEAMRKLPFYHSFGGKAPLPTVDLAEKLIGLAPVPMSKVFFANSGSEANDTAIKLIWYYNNALGRPEKKKIVSRMKAYHGVTIASASLTGLPNNHRDFDLPIARFLHTSCPHHYRFAKAGESEEAFAQRLADELDALITAEGPDTVAAFFAEPVMGAGGVIVPPRTYFDRIQPVLKKHDVLLVADEVICGFGRTGNRWGCDTFGIAPDMLTCAKMLSSAYLPISALMISEPIYRALVRESEKIGVFAHGFTYGGHPVAAAVALETLKIYEERNLLDHVRRVGPALQTGLRRLAAHPLVGEARGIGLIGGLEMVRDKRTREPFRPEDGIGLAVWDRLQERGVITRVMADTIAFAPPLVIAESEIAEILSATEKALDDVLPLAQSRGLAA